MIIDTREWMTAAEAARLLDVSPQRVNDMADDDGLLDVARPWERVTLVSRISVEDWLNGVRPPRIKLTDAREWCRKRTGVTDLGTLDRDVVRDLMRMYISEVRPRWTDGHLDEWALRAASREMRLGETS